MPANGKAHYTEQIRGVKYIVELLKKTEVDAITFLHGGARMGASFTNNRAHDANIILSKRLGKSVDTVRKYIKFSDNINDETLVALAKIDLAAGRKDDKDDKDDKVRRPNKQFFERIHSSKKAFIKNLNADANKKGEKLTKEDITKRVSGKVIEAYDQYAKDHPVMAFGELEPAPPKEASEKSDEKANINERFETCLSMIKSCQDPNLTGRNKIKKMLEASEEFKKISKTAVVENKWVYTPDGRAREYSPLALGVYGGCDHGCLYCFMNQKGPHMLTPTARKDLIKNVNADIQKLIFLGEKNQILLSFGCDAYCSIDETQKDTAKILKILLKNEFTVAILTKSERCLKDLVLFKEFKKNIKVGMTLTFTNDKHSKHFEPNATLPDKRFKTLKKLHDNKIQNFVSLEPVIDVKQSLEIIDITQGYVDEYKLGILSGKSVNKLVNGKFEFDMNPDYKYFLKTAVTKLRKYGKKFYVKKTLRECDPTFKLTDDEMDQDFLTLKSFK